VKRLLAWLWPTLFGPEEHRYETPVEIIRLPPEPMFKAPDDETWQPL